MIRRGKANQASWDYYGMFRVLWLPGMVQMLNNLTSFFPPLLKVTFAFFHIWIADLSHSEGHVVHLKVQLFLQSTWNVRKLNTDYVMSDITLIAGAARMRELCRKVEAARCGMRFTIRMRIR